MMMWEKMPIMNDLTLQLNLVLHDTYIYMLLSFIVFDIITGTLKAFNKGTVYSKINKHGITNHITILLFCVFFSWVFYVFDVGEFSKVLILFYILSYGLSIFENLGEMGLPLPQWLSDKFKLLQEETNKGDYTDEIKRP